MPSNPLPILDRTMGQSHPLERVNRVPRTCIWEITAACNLHCIHCDNHASRPAPRELSLPRLLETAAELNALGCRLVDITGGEPLMRSDWDELCRFLTSRSMDVALVTNGTLIDEEAVERAVAARVGIVSVSIDGLRATHDATFHGCAGLCIRHHHRWIEAGATAAPRERDHPGQPQQSA